MDRTMRYMSLTAALAAGVAFAAGSANAETRMQQGISPQAAPVTDVQQYSYTYDRQVPMLNNTAHPDTAIRHYEQKPVVINPTGIRYMSGGIGADEQVRFESARSDYPVKVVFADARGAYLSSVDVNIADASGDTVLAMRTDGPILLLDLDPGTYTLSANENGQMLKQKLTVAEAPKNYTLHFVAQGPQDYSMNTSE